MFPTSYHTKQQQNRSAIKNFPQPRTSLQQVTQEIHKSTSSFHSGFVWDTVGRQCNNYTYSLSIHSSRSLLVVNNTHSKKAAFGVSKMIPPHLSTREPTYKRTCLNAWHGLGCQCGNRRARTGDDREVQLMKMIEECAREIREEEGKKKRNGGLGEGHRST